MKISTFARVAALGVAATLVLAGCTPANEPTTAPTNTPTDGPTTAPLSGTLVGVGASAQEVAIQAWTVGFQTEHGAGVTVDYDPAGSGNGRTAIQQGAADFAGSDRAFRLAEIETGPWEACAEGSNIIELPTYVSPFAVIFNLDTLGGEESLNLDAETIAKIFLGEITNWNDPAIAAHNPGLTLPDLRINPVHRSDNSGTTENFTDYLAAAGAWPHAASGDWPLEGGEAANGTSGVISAVTGGAGMIGYADASRVKDSSGTQVVGTVAVKVGDNYVPFSPEAAAKTIDVSPLEEGRTAGDLAVKIDRNTTADGAYPLVLISYLIACETYKPGYQNLELLKAFLLHAASPEGQAAAGENAGSAPIGDEIRAKIIAAINSIS